MLIDGNDIARLIKSRLKNRVQKLMENNITPKLGVILAGNDPNSITYIKYKKKFAKEIGALIKIFNLPITDKLLIDIKKITVELNFAKDYHGIIIQRPIKTLIDKSTLNQLVTPTKDVDGFHPDTTFIPPVAKALLVTLETIFKKENIDGKYLDWLKTKKILLIGRGEAGGFPIIKTLTKLSIPFALAHSKTENIKKLCLKSDIIVSSVGKPNIVRHDMLKNKQIIIGVGITNEHGKIGTDYDPKLINQKVQYFTKTPGGIGPINIACLFDNLLLAAENNSIST